MQIETQIIAGIKIIKTCIMIIPPFFECHGVLTQSLFQDTSVLNKSQYKTARTVIAQAEKEANGIQQCRACDYYTSLLDDEQLVIRWNTI